VSHNIAFLHGGGQGSWVWDAVIDALGSHSDGLKLNLLALDVPGCGVKRSRETTGLSIEDVASELVADIETAGLRSVVLVGHSQAGQAMCFMQKQRPDLFRRLIYVSCSLPLQGQSVPQLIGTSLHGENEDEVGWPLNPATTEMVERYRAMFCNDMNDEQADVFLSQLDQDCWPLQTYSQTDWPQEHLGDVPSTFVLCESDMSLPASWQEVFARRLKCERVRRVDAGHQVMVTQPQVLANILISEAQV